MKYTILTLALLAAFNANATGNECRGNCTGGSTTHLSQAQSMLQGQTQYNALQVQGATNGAISNTSAGGNSSVNVDNDKLPVSSAMSASSNTSAECRYLQANSVQAFFVGATNTTMLRDLVCTLAKPLNDEQKLALCIESADYRKIRKQIGSECELK